jgi:hypothetical protein
MPEAKLAPTTMARMSDCVKETILLAKKEKAA